MNSFKIVIIGPKSNCAFFEVNVSSSDWLRRSCCNFPVNSMAGGCIR